MLVTEEQRATMHANGRDYARNPHFNPQPVVKLFDPLGGATWLLNDLDLDELDIESGWCDLGMGISRTGKQQVL